MGSLLKSRLIAGVLLFGLYKVAPNNIVKAMILGTAGNLAAAFIPYVNGTDIKTTVNAITGEVA
ncbi:MAG: hypothetical protein PHO76_02605 [Methylotenera sp.]|nr:hypothetical protein [Methylotenera sp.]MDD4927234.1 hypothetical protein [Methylotenera sp.]